MHQNAFGGRALPLPARELPTDSLTGLKGEGERGVRKRRGEEKGGERKGRTHQCLECTDAHACN